MIPKIEPLLQYLWVKRWAEQTRWIRLFSPSRWDYLTDIGRWYLDDRKEKEQAIKIFDTRDLPLGSNVA